MAVVGPAQWIGQVGDYNFADFEGERPTALGTVGEPGYLLHSFCCCGGAPVPTQCCPERDLPRQIRVTLRNSQFCTCYEGHTGIATYNEALEGWRVVIVTDADCGLDDGTVVSTIEVILRCIAADEVTFNWEAEVNTTCALGGFGQSFLMDGEVICEPFYAKTEDILDVQCCNATSPDQGLFYVEFEEI